ncbi:helix-turn-helix domain-containing protein [uncultured Sphingobacterium sp.]|uniref:helix-turn-helix domain-containing protein n=1 Tax=uncultured Sphingobacterium sp. TaxID=182688 RepID=UPI003749B715
MTKEENQITEEARRFKAFREAENLTQEEFGALLGKTKSHINKIEKGVTGVQLKDVKMLHEKKAMSYEWFYHGKGKRLFTKEDVNTFEFTMDLRNKIDLLVQKVAEQDRVIKKLVRDFYDKTK